MHLYKKQGFKEGVRIGRLEFMYGERNCQASVRSARFTRFFIGSCNTSASVWQTLLVRIYNIIYNQHSAIHSIHPTSKKAIISIPQLCLFTRQFAITCLLPVAYACLCSTIASTISPPAAGTYQRFTVYSFLSRQL